MSTKRKVPTRPGNMKSGEMEAERDSGFSDASSEHLSAMDTTDSEGSPGPVQPSPSPKTSSSSSSSGTLTVVGGSYSNLSPMIIMNNVVLKQPGDSPPALKPWRFSPAMEVVQPVVQPVVQQPQVVFLQPVVSHPTSSASKPSSNKHKRSKKYLPILKSYPKIAPRDASSLSSRAPTSSTVSVSSGSSSSSDKTSQNNHSAVEKLQRNHSNGVQNATPNLPLSQNTVAPVLRNQLNLPSMETTNCRLSSDNQIALARPSELPFSPQNQALQVQQFDQEAASVDGEGDDDNRRKRFCNTYNILSKSGLLDITLRTKELLRQNKRTQSDIEKLKEQTDLFLQALCSGDASICLKLQASLQEEEKQRESRDVKND